jgi:pimeloyl-ACP methyl ester carboxylesterase
MTRSRSEPPLIFIHDWFTDPTAQWAAQATRFGREYDCHFFHLTGHGDSAERIARAQPVLDHNLASLNRLIDSIENPVRIVAHGIGASLALRIAALRPDRLSCLVLISPVFRLERQRWLARLCVRLPALVPLYILLTDPVAERNSGPWTRLRARLQALRGANAALYFKQLLAGEEPYLAGIRAPVFLIAGDLDPLMGTRTAEHLSENLTGSRLLRYGHLGHNPHVEEPELVNSAIHHFLAAHRKHGALHSFSQWLTRVKKLIVGGTDSI